MKTIRCLTLCAVLALPWGAAAQHPAPMHTLGIELRGDTMIYRSIEFHPRQGGHRGRAWADYTHAPWTPEQKLFALSKLWMEVRRNYAYMERFGAERWDSLYRAQITPAMQTRNDAEFFRLLQRLCARLHNEQTFVFQQRGLPQSAACFDDGWHLRLIDVGGRVTVAEVSRDKAALVPPGSEVVSVNGQGVEACLEEVMSRVAASTDRARRRIAVDELLLDLVGTPHEVLFRRPDGSQTSVRLVNCAPDSLRRTACTSLAGQSWAERHEDFSLTWYPGDVACLKIGSFRPGRVFKAFHDAFPEVQARARGLIVDLRFNERGSNFMAAELLSHFTHDSTLYGGVWRSRIYDAGLSSWGARATATDTVGDARVRTAYEHYNDEAFSEPERSEYRFSPSREVLVVPTVLLVNDATSSAAELFLAIASQLPHVTSVGTPTAGCAGTVAIYELLPGLGCGICTREVTLPGGKEFVGQGLAPDIVTEDTLDDLLAGRDAALDKALELLGSEPVPTATE